jgi:cytochrome d ubiquinol oxidase subunit II
MFELFGFAPEVWLPNAFAVLMAVSVLAYVILDGFDLGVGILSAFAAPDDKDRIVASIGPFWDANETWLVLGIGLLLVAFPAAHGIILSSLYLPVTLMLAGLILRGAAFELRAKGGNRSKLWWNWGFVAGSALAALTQGFMLGLYVLGLGWSIPTLAFATLAAVCVAAGYCFLGAAWLIIKSEGPLQKKSIRWAQVSLILMAAGTVAVSVMTPLVSARVFERWFTMPALIALSVIPVVTVAAFAGAHMVLRKMPFQDDRWNFAPFALGVAIFALSFDGLAYSFYPFVVPDRLTFVNAASSAESLWLIFIGAVVILPIIIAYSLLSHWVFRGKASSLSYE